MKRSNRMFVILLFMMIIIGLSSFAESSETVEIICPQEEMATPAPSPESANEMTDMDLSVQETPEPPVSATYRYLTCTPGSEVPLYYDCSSGKPDAYLSRGTLVLVHEYAGGRARITFGGWKGWVDSGALTTKDPGSGKNVGYRYAYDESGTVPLYRYGFEYPIASVPSGAKVAVTDMKEVGYTYVMHGAVSGWAKNSSLVKALPEGQTAQEGSSYYYRELVGDVPGQPVQLYNNSSCGSYGKCGTLPEGTVVKVLSTQLNVRISYGGKEYYVKPANVFRDLGVGGGDSINTGITIPDMQTQPADEAEAPQESAPVVTDEAGKDAASASGKRSNRERGGQKHSSVEIVYLGAEESCIRDDRGERMVPTDELELETDMPEDKRIAYIYAPKTGKCSLWRKASRKAALVAKCKAGTVVMVLEYGREYCRIRYRDREGYVLTSCLRFADEVPKAIGTGKISYNGKATGSTTVNIRGAGNSKAHKIAEWKTGTVVTVFSHQNGWYEVECRGVHGWVYEDYIILNE